MTTTRQHKTATYDPSEGLVSMRRAREMERTGTQLATFNEALLLPPNDYWISSRGFPFSEQGIYVTTRTTQPDGTNFKEVLYYKEEDHPTFVSEEAIEMASRDGLIAISRGLFKRLDVDYRPHSIYGTAYVAYIEEDPIYFRQAGTEAVTTELYEDVERQIESGLIQSDAGQGARLIDLLGKDFANETVRKE